VKKKPVEETKKSNSGMILLKLKVKQSGEFSVIGFPTFKYMLKTCHKNFLQLSFCPIRKNQGVSGSFKLLKVPFDVLGNSFCEMAIATLLTRYRTLYTAGNNYGSGHTELLIQTFNMANCHISYAVLETESRD
jgi:hypothetical protein